MNGIHVTMGKMKRLSVLLVLLVAGMQVRSEPAQYTIKVGVDLVNVPFTVTDRHGRLVPGLTAADFAIEEDGRKQDILNFASENELPLTLAMLIDTSLSVRPIFDEEKTTANAFLESILRPKDLALAIGFDRSVTLVQDLTEDPKRLAAAINDLKIGPYTSLYDAIYLAANERLRHEAGRKAIILITDGADNGSKVNLTEALMSAHQADAVIYSISNAVPTRFGFGGGDGDPGTLKKLSEETGGAVFFLEKNGDFQHIFDQIARELRSQYTLGYRSTNPSHDGKFRRIKIVPRDSSFVIRSRRGYYAAGEVAHR
jgi:VWFA-related protein